MTPLLALALLIGELPPTPQPGEVPPGDLAKRPELIGREVVVEDRVRLLYFHEERGYHTFELAKTPVLFRLPPTLRYPRSPAPKKPPVVRLTGVLAKTGGELAVDVTRITPRPADLDRLNQAVAGLAPNDAEGRSAWARWAEARGAAYDDPALSERAKQLDVEALRIASTQRAPDPPAHWLNLAKQARQRGHEVEARALAHRAFVARRASVKSARDAERLAADVAAFFPEAKNAREADLGDWLGLYAADPEATYRKVVPEVRASLDRRLLADTIEKKLDLLAALDPKGADALAAQAREQLPDRPAVAARLESGGIDAMVKDVGSLRRDEVEALARRIESRGQADASRDLIRAWLNDYQSNRLSPGDAEGRVDLAELYLSMRNDRHAAEALLRQAERIDPKSRALADAYRRLGYRKINAEWVAPSPAQAAANDEPGRGDDSLRGATRGQVRAKLGKPDRIARSVTQGQVVEQWVYLSQKGTPYFVNFTRAPGTPRATVQRHGSLPD